MASAFPRLLTGELAAALTSSRAVALVGPRQSGKTTLARHLAESGAPGGARRYVSLDDPLQLRGARDDPAGWLAGLGPRVTIDEVQRAPELLLALKVMLDRSNERGQFLLTGSVDLVRAGTVADALPGRIEYLTLWPLAQVELERRTPTLLDQLWAAEPQPLDDQPVGRAAHAQRVVLGGFPELHQPGAASRSLPMMQGYLDTVLGRDLPEIAVGRVDAVLPRDVLRLIAARSGALANASALARDLGVDHKTAQRYMTLLENLFLVVQVPPWSVNLGQRVVRTPKLHLSDTGLMAALLGVAAQRLVDDGPLAGSFFETFVVTEVARLLAARNAGERLLMYRDRGGREVDAIIERPDGKILAIEVKASATVGPRDARHLEFLRDGLGDRFAAGGVVYLGASTVRISDRVWALPLSALST
ncbi:MAG: ATP-binding protein [Patulibacter sp.]